MKIMIIKFNILLLILGILLNYGMFSQNSTMQITLEECIKLAQKNSPSAKIARMNFKSKSLNYESFKSGYYPQLTLNGSVPGLAREINVTRQWDSAGNAIDIFLPQSQLSSSSNVSLSQSIPLTGGQITLSSGISRIDILESKNFTWMTTPLQISLIQPVFQFNAMKWDYEIEDLQNESNERQYVESMEDIAIDITQRFFSLYIAGMNVRNAEFNVAINDTLYQLSKGRYNVGKIAENDLLQSELALSNARTDLRSAKLDEQRAGEELILALGLEKNTKIEIRPVSDIRPFIVNPEKAVEFAKKYRSDIVNFEIQEKRSDRQISQTESNNSFNATITASYGFNKTAESIPKVYKDLLEQERLNLNFQVPLFLWGKGSSAIEAAYVDKERISSSLEIEKQQFELNVKYQALHFEQYQTQVAIAAKADTIAARRFDVAKNRYLIGKIDLNSLFIAQNEKDAALRSYIQTLKSYWVAYYTIRRLTHFDFERNQPIFYKYQE